MATRIEQSTNDLLHFTGKYNPTKYHAKNENKRKLLLRAYSRAQIWNVRVRYEYHPIIIFPKRFSKFLTKLHILNCYDEKDKNKNENEKLKFLQ